MCSGPNENEPPSVTMRTAGSPLMRGLDSLTAPRTTRTAPEEMSWSCQPVSSARVQHSSQTSTNSSRCSETKCRAGPEKATCSRQASASVASSSTNVSSSARSRLRAGSDRHFIGYLLLGLEETQRVGGAQRVRRRGSEIEIDGIRVGPVGPVDQRVDAEHPDRGVDRAVAVRGDVEENVLVDDVAVARARGKPLAVQRRQAGQQRKAHP